MVENINLAQAKTEARALLKDAQVSPRAFTALFLGISLLMDVVAAATDGGTAETLVFSNPLGLFVTVLTTLLELVLAVGLILYCLGVRRGEHMEYLTLFDGFSFVGKIILLYMLEYFYVLLWSLLLVVPGIIAAYRYRFAVYNLCENPGIGAMEALEMSKRQTLGYKEQLFVLDLSFLGWAILANLPYLFLDGLLYQGYTIPLSAPLQVLAAGFWAAAVQIFYLAYYKTTELRYFETAKRTSGVGSGIDPSLPDSFGGSDDGIF